MQYLLKISYDGKDYFGWAKQPNRPTITQKLEEATKEIFGKTLSVSASGRTDRYVHAISLPVLLRGDDSIDPQEVMNRLNQILPQDIRVNQAEFIENKFHVRYDAKLKKYRYLTNLKGEGDVNYYNNFTYPFDLEKFKKASKRFIGTMNYASFTGGSSYEDYERTIESIEVTLDDDVVIIEIVGNSFMRYMVRNIVGGLFAHNRGKVSDDEFEDWFTHPKKGKAHWKAVGAGLYLVDVKY